MSQSSPITYTVTEQHMCQLATLAHTGRLETCHGRALFLKAIAAHIMPNLRMEVLVHPAQPNAAEPPAVLVAYPMQGQNGGEQA